MSEAVEHPELKAYPLAKDGMQRFVITLPHKERVEEDAFKIELLPGKILQTDGVNRMRLGLRIEENTIQGWGYPYYNVVGKELGISTKIGVPEGTPKVTKFVSGQSLTIRYNSRLPIVIYAPKGQLVRYRIWQTDEQFKEVEPD